MNGLTAEEFNSLLQRGVFTLNQKGFETSKAALAQRRYRARHRTKNRRLNRTRVQEFRDRKRSSVIRMIRESLLGIVLNVRQELSRSEAPDCRCAGCEQKRKLIEYMDSQVKLTSYERAELKALVAKEQRSREGEPPLTPSEQRQYDELMRRSGQMEFSDLIAKVAFVS
jgi:hypothetical protein